MSVIRRWFRVVVLVFIVAPIVCWASVYVPCFVIHYLVAMLEERGRADC